MYGKNILSRIWQVPVNLCESFRCQVTGTRLQCTSNIDSKWPEKFVRGQPFHSESIRQPVLYAELGLVDVSVFVN